MCFQSDRLRTETGGRTGGRETANISIKRLIIRGAQRCEQNVHFIIFFILFIGLIIVHRRVFYTCHIITASSCCIL